ncbi:MAG: hypothetical protein SP1CHLAM54_13290 [Chlamydiia bacterium]|nr:hypothetical protein [Chlamydiia bacterium]MCH9616225.1 hypothetical protein [Chlamydiia bacterium]MCH9629789.1 hypothetical protein [Chlamydiia bacterium]
MSTHMGYDPYAYRGVDTSGGATRASAAGGSSPAPSGPNATVQDLQGLFGAHNASRTDRQNNEAMLSTAQTYSTFALGGRTVMLVVGAAVTAGSAVMLSPFFTTVGVVIGLSMLALGQSMHVLSRAVESGMALVRAAQPCAGNDEIPEYLRREVNALQTAYMSARREALVPLPKLEDLPVVGTFFSRCGLEALTQEDISRTVRLSMLCAPGLV